MIIWARGHMGNKIKKALLSTFISLCIIILFTGCGLIRDGILQLPEEKEASQDGNAAGGSNIDGQYNDPDNANTAPVAVMEIYQQNSDGYYLVVGNPVYFTAQNSFDGDGDDLEYSWEIQGLEKISSRDLEYTFSGTGKYEVVLTVSDNQDHSAVIKQVEVVEIGESIIISSKHSLTVEIQYTFRNNGPGEVDDLFCLMEVPRTYLPYQAVLDRRSNYQEGDRLFNDKSNVLAQFNLGRLEQGKTKTAYINCDVLLYEYDFYGLEGKSRYEIGDSDVSKYTKSEYFIDSDSNIIRSAAHQAIGQEEDPLKKAGLLYDFVVDLLEYDYGIIEDKRFGYNYASGIIQNRKGVCTDYSILYAALCRASGIPATIVQGIPVYSILNEPGQELEYGHSWVEIKLPGYGWIPIDITSEENFMGYNYFLNLQTYKGQGVFFKSLEIDGESYYPNGFYYTWEGSSEPQIVQDISYGIKGLKIEDLKVSRESGFLDEVGFILSEYNAAINHVNSAHKEEWIFNDPAEIAIEDSLLARLTELLDSLKRIEGAGSFEYNHGELIRISKDMIVAKQNQINCMKSSDYDCSSSYNNIFGNSLDSLFEYFSSMVDSYNEKY